MTDFHIGQRAILAQPETRLLKWRRGQLGILLAPIGTTRWVWKADYDGLVIRLREVELESVKEGDDDHTS